jgi:glycosyltransferase involved in cell wall biosynthesis
MHAAFVIPGDLSLPTGGYAYDRRVLALLPAEGVTVQHVMLPGSYPDPSTADIQITLRTLAALPTDTVLLIDGLAYGAMPDSLVAAIRQPIVALCHHPLCLEEGLDASRQVVLKASETAALARARATIVTAPSTARTLTTDFDVPASRITVAEPGTDRARRATGTRNPTQMLAVGSIVPRKGYSILVDALATLKDLNWQLMIAGPARDAGTAARLTRQIADAGLNERISFAGAVGDTALSGLYARADLFVMPSLFEGYGMVIAEAMARGLPIVCTTGGAAAETAPDAAALKVPPGDAPAFATAVRRALSEETLLTGMADASWRAGQNLPHWSDTARIIAGVLKGIAP